MFGKNDSKGSGSYTNTNGAGTSYLRNTIKARVFTGDSVIEDKLTKCQLYWKYYNNIHWAQNNDSLLSFNYVRAVIDKVVSFIIGKEGFEMNLYDTYGDNVDEDIERVYESLLNYNWNRNKKKVFLQKLLQMGSICGDAYVFLLPNVTSGYVEYVLLDSRMVVPLFEDGDYSVKVGYRVVKLLGTNDKEYIQKVTEYTPKNVKTYYVKETGNDSEKFEVENTDNDYDFLPIVHIENIAMSDTYGGKSDMEDIVKINKIFNEMSEDIKNIIDYYAQPTTVITGGTVGQLKRGLNQIWSGLPSEAHVFNLGLGEDLGASTSYLKMLKEAIHDLSGVPEEVLSKVQHISNTSAAALQMLYQPIIQVADKKCVSYGEGIEEINRMTFMMYSTNLPKHPLFLKMPAKAKSADTAKSFFDRYKAETLWKYNLPNDRLSMLNEATLEMSNRVGSRREIMERLGKKNIPKLMEEIVADSKEKVEFEKLLEDAKESNKKQLEDAKQPDEKPKLPAEKP